MRVISALVLLASAADAGYAEKVVPGDVGFGSADVVLMGELHDNPYHHGAQAEWVARMKPEAIVFEMLTPELALRAGQHRGNPAVLGAMLEWEERGWPDFAMYAPIFGAAPDAAIFGGGVPQGEARAAVAEGAAAVMGGAADVFGLSATLPEAELEARVEEQAQAHCGALPEDLLPGMVEAQRLRDAALARAVLAAMAETGGPVAVITGNGHARRDRGIPQALEAAGAGLDILSIGQFEDAPEDEPPFDLWTVTPAVDRGDPCAPLR